VSALGEIGALAFAGAIVAGSYFLGHHEGYSSAASACGTASLKAELMAEKSADAYLAAQVKKQDAAIATTQSEKDKIAALLASARDRVVTIRTPQDCSLGPDAVSLLNSVRKVGPR